MDKAIQIINLLIKIQESSTIFPYKWDGLNLVEVHCIDCIGTIEYANVTKIAKAMKMTRGAISKIGKRLLNKCLVESYQRPENNKEIYFRLTESGQQIFCAHQKCHDQDKREKLSLLNTYSEYEQSVIIHFLEDMNDLMNKKQKKV